MPGLGAHEPPEIDSMLDMEALTPVLPARAPPHPARANVEQAGEAVLASAACDLQYIIGRCRSLQTPTVRACTGCGAAAAARGWRPAAAQRRAARRSLNWPRAWLPGVRRPPRRRWGGPYVIFTLSGPCLPPPAARQYACALWIVHSAGCHRGSGTPTQAGRLQAQLEATDRKAKELAWQVGWRCCLEPCTWANVGSCSVRKGDVRGVRTGSCMQCMNGTCRVTKQ